ncbi:stonustoxin subunit alpha-like isoform X2 [Ctenopharyngodon idella]|uniref:stonustoxin subunit alpha-like isoform X2 n=1 Tax=Ctenopharyngodon idella TaxID=7959 RepID=UPI002231B886|nr:stonustoxin subunit alpha-like isoform X2 [Ctenopharyngodon idella]
MKLRVAVLLLLYKCLVFAPNVIFATEPADSESTCPLKICTDVLKQLQDLEIRLAKSEAEIEEIKKEKRAPPLHLCPGHPIGHTQDSVPKTRNDFLQYSRQLTLDLNTVNEHLRLSEGNTVITNTGRVRQSYPDHPDRFDLFRQVLCNESVSDRRSYWEIEWSGDYVSISVSYKSICRKGGSDECQFGYNDHSWSLFCSSSSYSFRHNKIDTVLPVKSISNRIGVDVDHSAGTLSFYSVSGDTMSLILTVQTTFTQPLYPGFRVVFPGSVKL